MKKNLAIVLALAVFICSSFKIDSSQEVVTNYLNISGPIKFDGSDYALSWSSHPIENFYKHEYLVKGDNSDRFNEMILVDLVTGSDEIKQVLNAKVAELKKLKKTNPVVNFEVIENKATGEYMLDFLVSENTPDGKSISIVERNVYRYEKFKDKLGKKGVLLFGVSMRCYGDSIDTFFSKLKTNRDDLINAVGQYQIPEVSITN
jgi:hypothetical protein